MLRHQAFSTTGGSGGNDGGKTDEEKEQEKNEMAHFNVVAAEARGDPKRRFTISTDGERRQKGACMG
jgi:hypothetical protein